MAKPDYLRIVFGSDAAISAFNASAGQLTEQITHEPDANMLHVHVIHEHLEDVLNIAAQLDARIEP